MTTLEMLGLIAILVIALLLRLIPSRVNGYFGSDAFYHLMVARKAREQKRLPEKDPGLVPEMTRVYPPLLHAILFPFKGAGERVAVVALSPVMDVITMIALYFTGVEIGLREPLWPLVLYAVSPLNIVDAASLNARPVANLALVLSLMFSYIYWQDGELLSLIVVVASNAGVMLSNKMALQVLVPCAVAVALASMPDDFTRGILILLSLPLAVAVATAATWGGYLRRILPDHIKFMRVHMAHGDYESARRVIPSPVRLVKSNPLAVLGPLLGLFWLFAVDWSDLMLFLVAWSLPVLLLGQFWIWGDSWRYLQFGTIPSALIATTIFTGRDVGDPLGALVLIAATAALAAASFIQLKRALKADAASRLIREMRRLTPEWRAKLNGALVYSNVSHYSIPWDLGVRVFSGNPSSEGMSLYFKMMGKGTDSLGSISSTASEVLGRKLDYYLLFKGFKEPRRDGFKILLESDSITILAE